MKGSVHGGGRLLGSSAVLCRGVRTGADPLAPPLIRATILVRPWDSRPSGACGCQEESDPVLLAACNFIGSIVNI